MDKKFSGRRIVVTGAGRGLGFSYAERLCREGASVIIAEIDPALGSEAEASLKAQDLDARFVQVDISSEISVAEMARIARKAATASMVSSPMPDGPMASAAKPTTN